MQMQTPLVLRNPTNETPSKRYETPSQSEMVRMICEIADNTALSTQEMIAEIDARSVQLSRQ